MNLSSKNIYLIRHGQTDFNVCGIVQGSGVDSSLNDKGIAQALAFHKYHKHVNFEAVITSKLKRTIETASPFIGAGIEHHTLAEFNEINWGIMEGVKPTPDGQRAFNNMLKHWSAGDYHTALEGGETPWQVHERMKVGIDKLISMESENILLVSHGRAMRILLCTMLEIPLSNMDTFPHDNTSLYKLHWAENKFRLDLRNDLRHIQK